MRCRFRSLSGMLAVAFFAAVAFVSCEKEAPFDMDRSAPVRVQTGYHHFTPDCDYDHVILIYQAGFNSLCGVLEENMTDLLQNELPRSGRDVVLVFRKIATARGKYSVPVEPVLLRLKTDHNGQAVADTLKVFPTSLQAATTECVRTVMDFVTTAFPSRHYGLHLSSHGFGWLPVHYFSNPSYYESNATPFSVSASLSGLPPVPYADYDFAHDGPAVRSFGQDMLNGDSTEMDIDELADAIPVHLDFIMFDACYMGSVEVAWQLKDVCDKIGFCPSEIIDKGFSYNHFVSHLISGEESDVASVMRDTYDYYNGLSGADRSVTVSVVDCRKLEGLATVCASLIDTHREALMNVNPQQVQRYYRDGRNYFFDLQDIFLKAGISSTEAASLQSALDAAVPYKAATPSFLENYGGFAIENYSGLSMYLPSIATYAPGRNYSYLNRFYRERISWNEAVGLVR